MLDRVINVLTSPALQHIAQNTNQSVTIETSLKAVGRPTFTLMDKNVDEKTRKYSAAKEFIYQTLCLGIYLAIIPFVFQRGGFKVAKKYFASEIKEFPKFASSKEYLSYHKLACMNKKDRLGLNYASKLEEAKTFFNKCKEKTQQSSGLEKIKNKYREYKASLKIKGVEKQEKKRLKLFESINQELKETDDAKDTIYQGLFKKSQPKKYPLIKGSIEFSSIVGSVIGLTLLAPELSHLVLHPIMKALHIDAPKAEPKNTDENKKESLDQKA